MKPPSPIADSRMVKALAHPLRVRVLGALEDRTASPSELAEELGANLSLLSYHVRKLEELGMIELVRKGMRRGAVEHFYALAQHPSVTRLPVALDDQGFEEATKLLEDVAGRLKDIEARSRRRQRKSGPGAELSAVAVLMLFEAV